MFGTIRKHSQALWIPIIIVIIVSFVIFFTPDVSIEDFFGDGQGRGQTSEAQADFTEARKMVLMNLSMQNSFRNQTLFQQLNQVPEQFRAQFAQSLQRRLLPVEASAIASSMGSIDLAMDANTSTQMAIKELDDFNRLDFFAHVRLERLKKAEAMGITVGMDTALQSIANDPRFQNEGKFDEAAYTRFIKGFSMSTRLIPEGKAGKEFYREFIRQEMVLQRMGELLTASGQFIPDHAVEANWAALNRRYTAQAVFFSEQKHEDNATQVSTNNVDLVKQHYQTTLTNRYAIPAKFKVAYVEVDHAPYVATAHLNLDIDGETKKAIEKHLSSTNTVDHYLDDNGTKLPAGADLNATARADILRQNQSPIRDFTTPLMMKEAKGFLTKLMKGQEKANLTAARLKEIAAKVNPDGNRTLPYVETEFVKTTEITISDTPLNGAAAELAGIADGRLILRNFIASKDGRSPDRIYFLARLGEVSQTPRKWDDLNATEQDEVRQSFVTEQTRNGVNQEVTRYRSLITELMDENDMSFAQALELDNNETAPHIALPPIKLNETEAPAFPQLAGYATFTDIRNAISAGGDVESGWISGYTPTFDHNKSDGFIVHVSEVAEGERPTPAQLKAEADTVRANERRQVNPMLEEVTALRHQLYLQQILDKESRIDEDLEFAQTELESLQNSLNNGEVTAEDFARKQEEVAYLEQLKSTHLSAEKKRLEDMKVVLPTANGGSSWRNYAIAALVILLILSFMGGDKAKPKRATATASESADTDTVDVESESDDDEPKKSDA